MTKKEIENTKHIYNIIDAFLDTPVVPALEEIGAIDANEKLCKFLCNNNTEIHTLGASPDTITFGDLAYLIAELDLSSAGDLIEQATEIYFTCFEACEAPKKIHDFLHLPYSCYLHYAEQLEISKEVRELYEIYRAEKAWTDEVSLLTIYNELKNDTGSEQTKKLIKLLILPLATLTVIPFI